MSSWQPFTTAGHRRRGATVSSRPTPLDIAMGLSGIALLAVAALMIASAGIHVGAGSGVDFRLLVAARGVAGPDPTMRDLMLGATTLGSLPFLVLISLASLVALAIRGQWATGLRFVAAAGLCAAVADLAKHLANRPRPTVVEHWATFTSSSLPSGHATDAAVVYLLLAGLAAGAIGSRPARGLVLVAAVSLVAVVGFSRVYLGVHWPSDVVAGWGLGTIWAAASGSFVRNGRPLVGWS